MSLNKENENIGYLLGRLFAVLVRVQEAAGNQTLVERYFTGASTTPRAMFTMLLKNAQNHLTKIKKDVSNEKSVGRAIYYDKIMTEIISKLDNGFPTSLSQYEQGMFMLGYYQQKESFFEKKVKGEDGNKEAVNKINNEIEGGSDND